MSDVSLALGKDYPELRDAVRRLCADFPGPYWRRIEREAAYPTEFIAALTAAGFLAALIPEAFGGSGLAMRAAAVILEEINANGCTATQGHAQMYVMGALLRAGSPAQKARYLPPIARGELRLQAFAVTEPTAGSDTTRIKTFAARDGESYVVNGQKVWTSRALHSDLMLLLARTTPLAEVRKRTDGLSLFLIDINAGLGRGLDIQPIETMFNHNTTEIFLADLRVPAENLIGEEGKGFHAVLGGLNAERILVASEAVGDGRWFLDKAVAYANERVVFDRPIGQNQGIQFPLARAFAEIQSADLAARAAAALFDADQPCGTEANIAKLLASEAAWHAGDACLQTFGGFGYAREFDIERKWRETRLFQTAPISTNLILAHLGQHALGLPRSY